MVAINKCPGDVPHEVPHLKGLMMLGCISFGALPSIFYILLPLYRIIRSRRRKRSYIRGEKGAVEKCPSSSRSAASKTSRHQIQLRVRRSRPLRWSSNA
jgi:hypothetical protein